MTNNKTAKPSESSSQATLKSSASNSQATSNPPVICSPAQSTSSTTSPNSIPDASTENPYIAYEKPYAFQAIIKDAIDYGNSRGMTWDDMLTKDNCSWQAPGHASSCKTGAVLKQTIQDGIDSVKHVQEKNGYQPGEFHFKVYFEPIANSDYLIYFLIG
jgi:hypothetical protein